MDVLRLLREVCHSLSLSDLLVEVPSALSQYRVLSCLSGLVYLSVHTTVQKTCRFLGVPLFHTKPHITSDEDSTNDFHLCRWRPWL